MNNSLNNILLSEDTGDDLKKKGYTKIADSKKEEYEKKGCKVVKSDSGTLYAKCESKTAPSPTPKPAQPQTTPAPQPAPTPQIVTIDSINTKIAEIARKVKFYNDNGIISKLDSTSPEYTSGDSSFDKSQEIINIVKNANTQINYRGYSPIIAYIVAVEKVFPNLKITTIDIPTEYTENVNAFIEKGGLIESILIKPLIGLSKLLVEQRSGYVRYQIERPRGELPRISQKLTNKKNNLTLTEVKDKLKQGINLLSPPLKFKGNNGLPDEAPIISNVKSKLGLDDVTSRVFTQDLENNIKEIQKTNNISFSYERGQIDKDLIIYLFPQ